MKTRNVLVVIGGAICLALSSCNSDPKVPEGEYLIEGELENVPDSTVVGLFKITGHSGRSIAYDTVIDGKFSFRDTITSSKPRKMSIDVSAFFNPGKGFPSAHLTIWVASGKYVKIKGEDKLIRTWKVKSRIPEQEAEETFRQLRFPEDKEWLQYSVQQEALRLAPRTEANKQKYQLLDEKQSKLSRIINLRTLEYMKDAPMSEKWLFEYCSFAQHYLRYKPDSVLTPLVRSLSGRMAEVDPSAEFYQEIMGYLNLPEQVVNEGDTMVDGDLYDLEGNLHRLSEFKGKYILLDFWDRGCGPCYASIPEMTEVSQQYKDQMAVVGICLGTEENMKVAIKEYEITGIQWRQAASGMSGLAAVYQVNAIPRYVLISPEGQVLKMWTGYSEGSLKERMKELIR